MFRLELLALSMVGAIGLGACSDDTNAPKPDVGGVKDQGAKKDGVSADKGAGPDAAGSACAAAYAGCTTYQDLTGSSATRTVTFGGTVGNAYDPKCVQVKVGQSVTFSGGTFSFHPLAQACGPAPVITAGTGTTASFTFNTAGIYGYYCTVHGTASGTGMAGSIQVVP
jgi:plastocyanin